MKIFSKIKQSGFTIIEVIAALVLAAVVAAGLIQYLGTSFTKSSISIHRLRQAYELQQVMENITEDYRENVKDETTLGELKGRIDTPFTYGTSYTVVTPTPKFIKFDGFIEFAPDQNNLLKVTIENESGIITALFSSSQ